MTLDLTVPARERDAEYERLRAMIWSWTATVGKGVALRQTTVSDPAFYAGDFQNAGAGTQSMRAVAGAHSLTVNASGNTLSSGLVTGSFWVQGDFSVGAGSPKFTVASATGDVETLGTLDVTGATTLLDTLDVTGATTLLDTLEVTGAVTLLDILDVTGATTLQDTLDVVGLTTLDDALIGGTLGVTDLATLGALTTTGHVTLGNDNSDTLTVIGVTTFRNTTPATLVVFDTTLLLATFGIGTKIQGDFTNATLASRTAFQTSTVDGATTVGLVPNGAGIDSQMTAWGASIPSATVNRASFGTDNTVGYILTQGSSPMPISLIVGAATQLQVDDTGIGFLAAPPVAIQTVAADATDLPTAIALVNDLSAALIAFGLCEN